MPLSPFQPLASTAKPRASSASRSSGARPRSTAPPRGRAAILRRKRSSGAPQRGLEARPPVLVGARRCPRSARRAGSAIAWRRPAAAVASRSSVERRGRRTGSAGQLEVAAAACASAASTTAPDRLGARCPPAGRPGCGRWPSPRASGAWRSTSGKAASRRSPPRRGRRACSPRLAEGPVPGGVPGVEVEGPGVAGEHPVPVGGQAREALRLAEPLDPEAHLGPRYIGSGGRPLPDRGGPSTHMGRYRLRRRPCTSAARCSGAGPIEARATSSEGSSQLHVACERLGELGARGPSTASARTPNEPGQGHEVGRQRGPRPRAGRRAGPGRSAASRSRRRPPPRRSAGSAPARRWPGRRRRTGSRRRPTRSPPGRGRPAPRRGPGGRRSRACPSRAGTRASAARAGLRKPPSQ